MTHICVSELTINGSDNGLSPGRRQAIIWNNTGLLLIEPLGTNFSEFSIGIQTFWFKKKTHLNMSSPKWRPFCLGLNVLKWLPHLPSNDLKKITWWFSPQCSYYWPSVARFWAISWQVDHDDVIKWRHFPRYWPFARWIHRSPVNSPHKGQWREALMFSLICVWINGWVNNRQAGDLRRHRAHYDVIVMDLVWVSNMFGTDKGGL